MGFRYAFKDSYLTFGLTDPLLLEKGNLVVRVLHSKYYCKVFLYCQCKKVKHLLVIHIVQRQVNKCRLAYLHLVQLTFQALNMQDFRKNFAHCYYGFLPLQDRSQLVLRDLLRQSKYSQVSDLDI